MGVGLVHPVDVLPAPHQLVQVLGAEVLCVLLEERQQLKAALARARRVEAALPELPPALAFALGAALAELQGLPQRRWLATRWPWLGALLALAIASPNLVWQMQEGWPSLEFYANAQLSSLFRWAVTLKELRIDNPFAALRRFEDGGVNVLELMDDIEQRTPPEEAVDARKRARLLRGASDPRSCTDSMNCSPAAFRSNAPSPRSASESRNRGAPSWWSAVGWN